MLVVWLLCLGFFCLFFFKRNLCRQGCKKRLAIGDQILTILKWGRYCLYPRAGLGFQLERSELLQNLSLVGDAFLALLGRERRGCRRQSPRASVIPCEPTLEGVGSGTSLAWGLEGLKSYPLGKERHPAGCELGCFHRCPCGPGEGGRLFLLLRCLSSPHVTLAPGGIPGGFLWSHSRHGCPLGRGGLGEVPRPAEGAEPFAGCVHQPRGTYSQSRRRRLGSGGREGWMCDLKTSSSTPLPAGLVFVTPPLAFTLIQ